jgi:Flp pilus assembly protein TadG
MGKLNSSVRKSKRSQRGQAMLESALIIIPLFAILCAIIDFSMAVFIRNSMIQAVREGTRYAVTGQTGYGGAACQDASIKNVVQDNAMGVLAGAAGLAKIAINYYDNTGADVSAAANSNAGGHVVKVSVTGVNWLWMLSGVWENVNAIKGGTGVAYSGLTIGAASSDVMEAPPGGFPPCR